MPAQYPFGSSSDRYKKKLFVDTGMTYVEVKARIVEPYTPPTPSIKVKELQVINAPSHFHQMGLASYRTALTLLFDNKQDFAEYMAFSGWTHKFYDEKGAIYLGAAESVKPNAKEASTKYLVDVSLILIKKDSYGADNTFAYQDLVDDNTGTPHWAKADIEEMANLGLLSVLERDGQPILYFRPNAYCTRAEFISFLNRTRRFIERVIRE